MRQELREEAAVSMMKAGANDYIVKSNLSRFVPALEREIGASLLARTTRVVTLTEAGIDFLARVEAILADLDEASRLNPLEHQLSDPVAPAQVKLMHRIVVDHNHLDLTPISGVKCAR